MKKPQRRGPAPSAPIGTLEARAAEALAQERFKEAIELYKLVIRQDPRPEWKQSLADAYLGRGRALAAKKMFKEAAMVLENTLGADGTVRDPLLYLNCLILDGQQQKAAAHALQYVGRENALPAAGQTALDELTAALLVAVPQRPVPVATGPADSAASERTRWLELAAASRDALAAWVNGASPDELDRQLNRISLRSAFKPVRLLLKSITNSPQDAERSRRLLEAVSPGSPFFPFRQAVEAALPCERGLDADGWNRLSQAQQAFVAQTRGLSPATAQFLARSAEAERSGPAAMFALLLKQPDLPPAEVRSACLNLLPQLPDRVAQFEKSFGPLSALERHRIQALAAEARGDWEKVERSWRAAAAAIADADPQAGLSRGVIFRHLAQLAAEHREIEGDDSDDPFTNPVVSYLERSYRADPDYVPAVLELIGHYRKDAQLKDWHRLADEAVQRFPENSAVLLAASESAMARKAFKKAAGFAHRLLKIDPINPTVRRQMIELQVAHARKQVRSKRPDLAAKELSAAAEWERADAPSALLRIAHGLVDLQTSQGEEVQTRLREGVQLAGGGVGGWFRACLEGELMKLAGANATLLRRELAKAREMPPTREAVMAIVSALGQAEVVENKRVVSGLLLGMRAWLTQATAIDWPPAEFQALADTLIRFGAFELLGEFARAARRREPTNPVWRFHEIVARADGNADRLYITETNELVAMAAAAADREDFHTATRIERFLDGSHEAPFGRRRRRRRRVMDDDLPESLDADIIHAMMGSMISGMPKAEAKRVRDLVGEFGREGTVVQLVRDYKGAFGGNDLPEPMLRMLCEAIVAQVMDGSRPGQARAGRRIPF